MKKNKTIINNCPNFYKISNFDFFEGDYISEKLIEFYKEFIFRIDINEEEDIKLIKQLDFVVNKYIEDYYFRKEMQRGMIDIRVKKSQDLLRDIVEAIINCFDNYENNYTRNIYFARWI